MSELEPEVPIHESDWMIEKARLLAEEGLETGDGDLLKEGIKEFHLAHDQIFFEVTGLPPPEPGVSLREHLKSLREQQGE